MITLPTGPLPMLGYPHTGDRRYIANRQLLWLALSASKMHQAYPGAPDYTDYYQLKDNAQSVGFNFPLLVGAKRRSRKAGPLGSSSGADFRR